ncbi:hypothetical protein [Bacillus sp. PS06]|uniref:hypothetical protein n=1 Tax=Bacillus sp. PS06 TaxID=2764176 RepID=UPI00177B8D28|nr:hypothetical protein [Bacillus sp. PS06]MBD8071636.1 hypothetical protein [Bacillus sp. PS06]
MLKNENGILINLLKVMAGLCLILLFVLFIMLPIFYQRIWPTIMEGAPAKADNVDVLAFWGAVFSGLITLLGVYYTIRYSQKEINKTLEQQDRDLFITRFGAIVLEINSISYELKKFRNYLDQLQHRILAYAKTGVFEDIVVEFDVKDDYKKIRGQVKPDLKIITNRLKGKAAHADGFIYSYINELSKDILKFQDELTMYVDRLTNSKSKKNKTLQHEYKQLFEHLNHSVMSCDKKLEDYREELENRFMQFSKKEEKRSIWVTILPFSKRG